MLNRRLSLTIVAVLVLTQCACSRIEFAYNYLDWLVGFYIERYVELTPAQRDLLSNDIDALKNQHCRDTLPGYIKVLDNIQDGFRSGMPPAERIHSYADIIVQAGRDLADQAYPAVARLLISFSDEQVEELLVSFERNNTKFVKKLKKSSIEETAKEYRKARVADLEHWIGELSDEQLTIVTAWSRTFRPLGLEGLAVRRMWQQEFAELLQHRNQSFTQFFPRVRAFFEKRRDDPSGQYRKKLDYNKAETADMVAAVLAKSSREQRSHLDREIDDLRNDLRSLVCQSDGPNISRNARNQKLISSHLFLETAL